MSAWLVSHKQIDTIVTYAVIHGIITVDEATNVGNTLLRANHYSLHVRYGGPIVRNPKYNYDAQLASIHQTAMTISCLNYQSCEYRSWDKSKASKFLKVLLKDIEQRIPNIQGTPEYDNCKWSY